MWPRQLFSGFVVARDGIFKCEIYEDDGMYYAYINDNLCDQLAHDKADFIAEFGDDYGWHLLNRLPDISPDTTLEAVING